MAPSESLSSLPEQNGRVQPRSTGRGCRVGCSCARARHWPQPADWRYASARRPSGRWCKGYRMWRHPALRPLSREHFTALSLVRDVRWAAASGVAFLRDRAALELAQAWRDQLAAHFDTEERVLLEHMSAPESDELLRQHLHLRNVMAPLLASLGLDQPPAPDDAEVAAEALEVHVRWEEQTLFQGMQERLGAQPWAEIAAALGVEAPAPAPEGLPT